MMTLLAVIAGPTGIGVRYEGTAHYATLPTDTPANQLFGGRLLQAVYERAVSFVVWTRATTAAPVSELVLINRDGALDAWPEYSWRGVQITLKLVAQRAAYSTATTVGQVTVERCGASGQSRIRLVCRSALERMAKPITRTYPQTISNEQKRGQTIPMTLGHVRWSDPAARRLHSVSSRGLYDVADDVYEALVEVRSRGLLQTEQPAPLLPTGGFFADVDECLGFHFGQQLYKLAAEVRGQIRRGGQLLSASTFPTGSGGYPDNFDVMEGGAGSVKWLSAGNVQIDGDGTASTYIAQDVNLTAGALYQFELQVSAQTGTATLFYGSGHVRDFETVGLRTIVATFTAVSGTDDVRVGFDSSATGSLQISAWRVYRVYRVDSLTEILRFVAGRCGLTDADIDLTACAAIEADTPYRLAFATTTEINGDTLARLAAQSYGCALYQDRHGKLVPVRLAAPAASPDYEIPARLIAGDIEREPDEAPGLSTRLNWGRNYQRHTDDDMSGITDADLRAQLAREVSTVTTTVTLHGNYADAAERAPIETLLSDAGDAQDEIDRVCGLYTVARSFWTLRVRTDRAMDPYLIEPGQTLRITHPRAGLAGGKLVRVVLARSQFVGGGGVELVVWG